MPGPDLDATVSPQSDIIELYTADLRGFRAAVGPLLAGWGVATPACRDAIAAGPAAFDPPDGPHASARTS